jgi:UPF0755 protein
MCYNLIMRWKVVIPLFVVSVGGLVCTMIYCNLDPSLLTTLSFYEDLANPSIRIISVPEGLRKEEIADIMGNKLGWDENEKEDFINSPLALNTVNREGYYFPKTYMILNGEAPTNVSSKMFQQFSKETSGIKKQKSTNVIKQDTAIKIASIIQREAGGKGDMKLISGIIWNRLFNGMNLQIDATLQYAKGNEEDGWWEQVTPKDKKINSPYNTYKNAGLPPSPISNPGLAAIEAAYNPQKTSCLFYLHDKNKKIHCATTYEEHKRNIEKYY